jgi:ribosomal protein S12 methylthiotransferase
MSSQWLHVVALGCPKNRVDVEVVVALAQREGFALTDDASAADVVLVATCGFVAAACQESIDTILELHQARRRGTRLVVAGCLPQRYGEALAAALTEADAIVGTSSLPRVVDAIAGRGPRIDVGPPSCDLARVSGRRPSGRPGTAYVKVADGCSRRCAFCTIPSIRGPYRSRPVDEICDEARELAVAGVKEINLVAQDLTAFGRDEPDRGEGLAELLEALARVDGLRWIRPLYLYPEARLRRVMSVMAATPRIVPYLDLPMQHASDSVLKRMKRGHAAQLLSDLFATARRLIPGVSLRTTVIVGHPGEGPDDVDDLVRFIERVRFEHLGVFRFSPEDGTDSCTQLEPVSKRDAYARYRRVMAVQRRISRQRCRELRGRTLEVLVEGPSEESPLVYVGRHAGQAPEVDGVVYLDRPAEPGSMVSARIVDSGDYDLFGEVLDDDG